LGVEIDHAYFSFGSTAAEGDTRMTVVREGVRVMPIAAGSTMSSGFGRLESPNDGRSSEANAPTVSTTRLARSREGEPWTLQPPRAGLQCSVCSPPDLPARCPLWCSPGLVRLGAKRGGDVGSQSAPVVRGAWPPETGLRGFGSRRSTATAIGVPIERPLAGAAHVAERPICDIRIFGLVAEKRSFIAHKIGSRCD